MNVQTHSEKSQNTTLLQKRKTTISYPQIKGNAARECCNYGEITLLSISSKLGNNNKRNERCYVGFSHCKQRYKQAGIK